MRQNNVTFKDRNNNTKTGTLFEAYFEASIKIFQNEPIITKLENPCRVIESMQKGVESAIPTAMENMKQLFDISLYPDNSTRKNIYDVLPILIEVLEIVKLSNDKLMKYHTVADTSFTWVNLPDKLIELEKQLISGGNTLNRWYIRLFKDTSKYIKVLDNCSDILGRVIDLLKQPFVIQCLARMDGYVRMGFIKHIHPIILSLKTVNETLFTEQKFQELTVLFPNKTDLFCADFIGRFVRAILTLEQEIDLKNDLNLDYGFTDFGINKIVNWLMRASLWYLGFIFISNVYREVLSLANRVRNHGLFFFFHTRRYLRETNFHKIGFYPIISVINKRFDFSILEAIYETAPAVAFQTSIVVLTYFSVRVVNRRLAMFIAPETQTFTLENFCPDCVELLSLGANTPITRSAAAGLFAFSMAQFNLYSVRHESDMNFCGKVVYFLACFFNSVSAMVVLTTFYCLAIANLFPIMVIILKLANGLDLNYAYPPEHANETIVTLLIILVVVIPIRYAPEVFSKHLHLFVERYITSPQTDANQRQRGGYGLFSCRKNFFLFLPVATNTYSELESLPTVERKYQHFSKNQLSRSMYRLRFTIDLICRIVMQNFYILLSLIFLHTSHILLHWGIASFPHHLQITTYPEYATLLKVCALVSYPALILSFGFLYLYYQKCHPWKSEGLSIGFEPSDSWNQDRFQVEIHADQENFFNGQWHYSGEPFV